jgi:hypothetical protein
MGISAGLATLACLGVSVCAGSAPSTSVPAYVSAAAVRYLKAAGLRPSAPGPLRAVGAAVPTGWDEPRIATEE